MDWHITLNFRMFVPLVILISTLFLFLRKTFKYEDTRMLFLAFACLIAGAFFGFIEPIDPLLLSGARFFEHAVGATVTGWLLAMNTYSIYKNGEEK